MRRVVREPHHPHAQRAHTAIPCACAGAVYCSSSESTPPAYYVPVRPLPAPARSKSSSKQGHLYIDGHRPHTAPITAEEPVCRHQQASTVRSASAQQTELRASGCILTSPPPTLSPALTYFRAFPAIHHAPHHPLHTSSPDIGYRHIAHTSLANIPRTRLGLEPGWRTRGG